MNKQLRKDPTLKGADIRNQSTSTKVLFSLTLQQGGLNDLKRKASGMRNLLNRQISRCSDSERRDSNSSLTSISSANQQSMSFAPMRPMQQSEQQRRLYEKKLKQQREAQEVIDTIKQIEEYIKSIPIHRFVFEGV